MFHNHCCPFSFYFCIFPNKRVWSKRAYESYASCWGLVLALCSCHTEMQHSVVSNRSGSADDCQLYDNPYEERARHHHRAAPPAQHQQHQPQRFELDSWESRLPQDDERPADEYDQPWEWKKDNISKALAGKLQLWECIFEFGLFSLSYFYTSVLISGHSPVRRDGEGALVGPGRANQAYYDGCHIQLNYAPPQWWYSSSPGRKGGSICATRETSVRPHQRCVNRKWQSNRKFWWFRKNRMHELKVVAAPRDDV